MTREEKIAYIVESAWEIEMADKDMVRDELMNYTDEQLDKEVQWYDYLLDK
ncbi:hypothetical protein ABEU97_20490 [Priestia megaterium]